MRAPVLLLFAPAACDLAGPPSPWARSTLLAEGAERVEVETRLLPTMHDPQTEYVLTFSHDGGRTFVQAMRGKTEGFQRRVRAYRLPDGRLASAVFTEACAEASPGRVVCGDFYDDRPPPDALRPVLAELARDRALEAYVRVRAACSLARSRAPGAGALLASMLADGTAWGPGEAASLKAAREGLPRE